MNIQDIVPQLRQTILSDRGGNTLLTTSILTDPDLEMDHCVIVTESKKFEGAFMVAHEITMFEGSLY